MFSVCVCVCVYVCMYVCVHVDFLFFLPEMVNKVEYIMDIINSLLKNGNKTANICLKTAV